MKLDFTPLRNAIARLDEGLKRYLADPADIQIRDGLIQRFEFTYDLSHKSLRRAIETASANPEAIDHFTFPELIRTGCEQGLLAGDWGNWKRYREKRNTTSHTYDEQKALEVVGVIPEFLEEAKALQQRLRTRFEA